MLSVVQCCYAKCRDFLNVMLSVVMLNVVKLSVVAPAPDSDNPAKISVQADKEASTDSTRTKGCCDDWPKVNSPNDNQPKKFRGTLVVKGALQIPFTSKLMASGAKCVPAVFPLNFLTTVIWISDVWQTVT